MLLLLKLWFIGLGQVWFVQFSREAVLQVLKIKFEFKLFEFKI